MLKSVVLFVALLGSASSWAGPSQCLFPLRSTAAINPIDLSQSYVVQVHKTIAGELDPYVLGDGGVTSASLISDAGSKPSTLNTVFVLFENSDAHPITDQIDNFLNRGISILLIKKDCVSPMINKKQTSALYSLVIRHMKLPKGSQVQYYIFQ